MPLDSVIVSAWLADTQTAQNHVSPYKRPHGDLDITPRLQPRKRQALVEAAGNMNREPESPSKSLARRRSPRKPADAPKDTPTRRRQPQENAAREAPVSEGERGRSTGRDAALRSCAHPILSPSSSQYTIELSANTASVDGASWDVVSAGQKSKTSARRLPSPTKTVSDMEMLDKPIRYCFCDEDEHPLPPELISHWKVLETLCNNVGIIPTPVEVAMLLALELQSRQADMVLAG
ncbi:hypothetical protein P154DRAFT_301226 [Amniculicola lignicola CBS 123094]|uniref:Uncharacterized protein n=1 Tax=Amniculicola lignicola CBS 123094 TaxID=1392246 RepID=A0A6A5W4W7_9PLEO|nr:hypothetical protein P154DRAFT_301226 [Amniculicola lignicola CBS 123094]